MPKSLAHLIHQVPPTNPQNNSIPDSCGEESSDEEVQPKPLSVAKTVGGKRYAPLTGSSAKAGPSRIGGSGAVGSSGQVRVEATVGTGGKLVPQTVRSNVPTWYYTVQWRKPQTKKTWDGDAFLRVEGNKVTMITETGDSMATSALIGGLPESGNELRIGQYECEVDNEITVEEFKQSTCILNKPAPKAMHMGYAPSTYAKPFKPPTQTHAPRPLGGAVPARGYTKLPHAPSSDDLEPDTESGPSRAGSSSRTTDTGRREIPADRFYAASKPKADRIVIGEKSRKKRLEWGGALHDPKAEGAVIMERPDEAQARKRGTEIVDVVLDPFLTSKMRDHQKAGVKFMYSCVMGLSGANATGCILADEMGLGKTLQTIALIYTLLKQSPFENERSIIGKALVVCPVSLVENWKKEFRKWVRPDQLTVVAADATDHAVKSFTHHRGQHVLIIGYERLRKVIKTLASCQPPIDLIVCDEGHRLKSKDNKTTKMFEQLRTRRRIILSGTPVQNDLSEYFAMVDFTCPGLLGTYAQFVKHYEKPIMASRSVGAKGQKLEDGKARADELANLSKKFILRRTAQVLENYLPAKNEYVLFVAPTDMQMRAYGRVVASGEHVLRGEQPLGYIDLMRKISNTPTILRLKKTEDSSRSDDMVQVTRSALQEIPSDLNTNDVAASGKLMVLDKMLHSIFTSTDEKVVIVSNYVVTLNIIQEVCKARRYPYLRLDGQTPQKQRQELVDDFNRTRRSESFVFLLSAKAGGVGLNLIGASRLILFDSDWNPSTDLQAMARIHRDGQKKPVFIYRLLTTNSIDEKIYQRQLTKVGLADQMVDHGTKESTGDSFTFEDLRDIFRVNMYTDGCQTHDLLGCPCIDMSPEERAGLITDPAVEDRLDDDEGDDETTKGFAPASQYDAENPKMMRKAAREKQQKLAALRAWTHFDGLAKESFLGVSDTLLYNLLWKNWEEHGSNETSTDVSAAVSELADDGEEAEMADLSDVANEDGDVDADMVAGSEEDEEVAPVLDYPSNEDLERSAPKAKEAKNRLDLLFLSDEEFDGPLRAALEKERSRKQKGQAQARKDDMCRSAAEDWSDDGESSDAAIGNKRKTKSALSKSTRSTSRSKSTSNANCRSATASRTSPSESRSRSNSTVPTKKRKVDKKGKGTAKTTVEAADTFKKYNLGMLTQSGQGGRIMFVFEKKSDGKMLGE